jgi:hypothetical protein
VVGSLSLSLSLLTIEFKTSTEMAEDILLGAQQQMWRPSDYSQLVMVMVLAPEVAIFKRFESLAMLNNLPRLLAQLKKMDEKRRGLASTDTASQDEHLRGESQRLATQ